MYPKQTTVAMILAGGQGSRLGVLTRKLAKPAVPYGGKYRIIDFPLSNCVNSGISAVGVLTQYQPLVLNEYIGNGQPWDLDGAYDGVTCLSPYQQMDGAHWYSGTANAIYRNMNFIERYDPEYVVVLSGDHIYKMDYAKMISAHKKNKAACTIAVIDVPLEEASRFGILNTNPDGSIYEFEEKPKNPKSTNASMGIYVFSWDKLRKYLEEDEANPDSSNDFGKDVLPAMLEAGERMFAYEFEGYWKDVGTIDSLWEANMDLLDPKTKLDLSGETEKIYSRNPSMSPQYIGENAKVQNSLVSDGCDVDGTVEFSVLFPGVTIGKDAVVTASILMPGAVVEDGAVVEYAIVSENAVIGKNAHVGDKRENIESDDDWGIAVVGDGITIGENCVVKPNTMVDTDILEVE
ncbi:MAG: glucose-1-phosphate adenylyltransferase [Acutalibacteraceae bacterium]|nr:glucose-1-phosphate adenylyltransferase [Acutalibacteraceae bacterium]